MAWRQILLTPLVTTVSSLKGGCRWITWRVVKIHSLEFLNIMSGSETMSLFKVKSRRTQTQTELSSAAHFGKACHSGERQTCCECQNLEYHNVKSDGAPPQSRRGHSDASTGLFGAWKEKLDLVVMLIPAQTLAPLQPTTSTCSFYFVHSHFKQSLTFPLIQDFQAGLKKALSGDVETLLLELLMPPLEFEANRLQQAMVVRLSCVTLHLIFHSFSRRESSCYGPMQLDRSSWDALLLCRV